MTNEELLELFYEGELVEDKIVGRSRWAIHIRKVLRLEDGSLYAVTVAVGATEMQDVDAEILRHGPVKAVQKTVTVYE